ncbi:MAG: pilus assembly protein TadG-related protein [Persicimonas sp.]
MKLSIQKLNWRLRTTHRDDSGAVALLCLAAVLALMMIAWVILDVQKSTRDKVMLQGAADTAAFSHASVEARSMNMISYSNIAKRSIVGIHTMYPGMFLAYTLWLIQKGTGCQPILSPPFLKNPSDCWKFIKNVPQWVREALNDHSKFSGNPVTPYLLAGVQTFVDLVNTVNKFIGWANKVPGVNIDKIDTSALDEGGGLNGGNSANAHLRDVEALDNYQHYMMHITPWWAWAEQLSRGWHSGATTVASFPPPPGEITVTVSAVQNIINKINGVLAKFGVSTIDLTVYHGNDNLPITKGEFGWCAWLAQMFLDKPGGCLDSLSMFTNLDDLKTAGNLAYGGEHAINAAVHRQRSSKGAKSGAVVFGGATLGFVTMLQYTRIALGDASHPYSMNWGDIGSEADWLKHTSNLSFAYINDPSRMNEDRAKLSVPSEEYSHRLGLADEMLYESSGYWTMAKSEITFNGQGWKPDLWHPSWTARMRPVHLPGEFEDGDYNMNTAYNQTLPYLALSAQVASIKGGGSVDAILNSIRDMALMELYTSAMGPSTIEGVAK